MNSKSSFKLLVLAIALVGLVKCTDPAIDAAAATLNQNKPGIKIYVEKPIVQEIPPESVNPDDVQHAVPVEKPLGTKDDQSSFPLIKPKENYVVDQDGKMKNQDGGFVNGKAPLLIPDPADIHQQKLDDAKNTFVNGKAPLLISDPADQQKTNDQLADVHLKPMPLIFPSILSNLPPFVKQLIENHQSFINNEMNGGMPGASNIDINDNQVDDDEDDNDHVDSNESDSDMDESKLANNGDKKHGFMSIFLFKSNNQQNGQDQPSPFGSEQQQQQGPVKSSILIMKILPKPFGGLFGSDTDPDNSKKQLHLLGGPSDPDSSAYNKIHIFGSDSDLVDRFRDHGMMTGNEDMKLNSYMEQPTAEHVSFVDRVKNFFKYGTFSQPAAFQQPFVIKTDDGSQAFISNDIGYGSGSDQTNSDQPKKKCMMYGFMRLKASAYYRTIIHLLFFTGIALFILFIALLTLRMFRRKRAFRYHSQQNLMNVSSIDGASDKMPNKSNKLFWFSIRDGFTPKTSDLSASSDKASFLMPQPPPAYDQVLIKDGNEQPVVDISSDKSAVKKLVASGSSSLVNSLASAYKNKYTSVSTNADNELNSDTKSILSMPPDYDETTNKKN